MTNTNPKILKLLLSLLPHPCTDIVHSFTSLRYYTSAGGYIITRKKKTVSINKKNQWISQMRDKLKIK
jgi:hypothetical protein